METIPLYGDMVIVPFKTVEMCPSYDASKWPLCNSKSKMSKQDFSAQVLAFKQEHNTYLCEIMQLLLLVSGFYYEICLVYYSMLTWF